jgi:hypothetical protein
MTTDVRFKFAVTSNPTAEWTARQLLQAFPWDHAPRYLLRDRDSIYGEKFCETAKWIGIREVVTAPRSPWQNACAERCSPGGSSRGRTRYRNPIGKSSGVLGAFLAYDQDRSNIAQ